MPKKKSKKQQKNRQRQLLPNVFTRFATLALGVLVIVFVYALFTKTDQVRVLGESTVSEEYKKEYIAEKEASKIIDTTQVDCVGPDGGHFTTTYTECHDFNKKWGNKDFKYTKLKSDEDLAKEKALKEEKLKRLESEKEATKEKLAEKNTEKKEIKVIKTENKTYEVAEKKQTEETSSEEPAKAKEVQEKPSEKEIKKHEKTIIRSGDIEAETDLTVKVDETSNKLSVTTESGSHEIKILPAHAVQNLIQLDILSSIESSGENGTASQGGTIQLNEVDGNPVFEVTGLSQKKVLGIFPVAFSKKIYVSVDDGKIVKTDERFTNKLLQLVSF